MTSATGSTPRTEMAAGLKRLGLYATSSAVLSGKATLTEGVLHVRDYCLPNVVKAVEEREQRNAESPPVPGTWGASALPDAIARRDELQAFLDRFAPPEGAHHA